MKMISLALALFAASSCVGITYQRAGQPVTPQPGQALLVTRVRFVHDQREFFPWEVSLVPSVVGTRTERHLWLLRLHPRAVSAELHPDPDGSLAIWIAAGDYALVGSTELPEAGAVPYEVLALLRVPAGAVTAYAGELTFATETHEGGWLAHGEFGDASIAVAPNDSIRPRLESRLGPLPAAPVLADWCIGERVPGFTDPQLGTRARQLLDGSCANPSGSAPRSAQPDTTNPARITIYDARDTVIGELVLGRSTLAEAARLLSALGGLGPRRENEVTFHVGSTTLRPRVLYTPPATMHQLYFEQDTLVMVVAGVPHGLPATRAAFLEQFPKARETHRESMWYELQTPLSECVWLIAVFTTSADRLESNGWARVCSKD